MRHGKKFNHLGRKAPHRKAMLANMACSLIEHKQIKTTVAKAKALRKYVEPLITKSKKDTTHSRRVVFSYLQNKEAIKELFGTVANRIGDRPGGYTRILKIGNRLGDNAEMAIIELVDFNEFAPERPGKGGSTSKKRRRRGGGKKKVEAAAVAETVVEEEGIADKIEDVVEEAVEKVKDVAEKVEDVIEDAVEKVEEVVEDIVEKVEEITDGDSDDDEKEDDKKEDK